MGLSFIMPKPEPLLIFTTIENGKVKLTEGQKIRRAMFLQQHEGIPIVVRIDVADKDKSAAMMRAYRGLWLKAIAQEIGIEDTKEELEVLHRDLMLKFNPVYSTNHLGETVAMPGSLSDLDHFGFMDYIEKLDRWFGTRFGQSLPETKKK